MNAAYQQIVNFYFQASKKAEEFKKKGNEFYSQHFYKESIDCYTDALKIE